MRNGQLVYQAAGYLNVAGAATTVVKAAAGQLQRIVVNTSVDAATITVYDNTAGSGTLIATITLSGTVPILLDFGLAFLTGLTIVTSGATDLTVVYQ